MQSTKTWFLTGAALLALASPAYAAGETPAEGEAAGASNNDEIVVTARYRAESVQDVGASVAGIVADQLREQDIRDTDDLSRLVAGLQNIKTRQNNNNIAIRGVIDAKSGFFATSSVYSVFLDDVSVASPSTQRDYSSVDLNRIEVIRGPQPTLFGEGAVGGVIRYFTNDPDLSGPAITGQANARFESIEDGGFAYGGENATSLILVPEKLGLRVSGFYRKDEGFIDNPSVGEDVNDFDTVGGRAVLLARPTDALEIRLSAFLARDDMGESTQVDPGSDPEDLIFSVSPLTGVFTDDFDLYAARINYEFGNLTLTSISGYYERNTYQSLFSAANSFGLAPFFASDTPGVTIDTTTFSTDSLKQEQWTQELRLVSDFDGPLNFTSGLYFRDKDISQVSLLECAGCAAVTSPSSSALSSDVSNINSRQYSGFLELTLAATDRLRIIGGARYVDDKVNFVLAANDAVNFVPRFDASGIIPWTESDPLGFLSFTDYLNGLGFGTEFEFHLQRVLPRGGIEFDVADNMLFYANAAVGARNGGVGQPLGALTNSGGDPAAFIDSLLFDEDSVLTFEGGLKTSWMDGDLIANIGIFHSRFKDTQMLVQYPAANVINGSDQRIIGLELETSYRVSDSLSAFFNAAILDAEFTDAVSSTLSAPPGETAPFYDIAAGNSPIQAPRLSLSTGYSFSQPIGGGGLRITSSGVFQHLGKRYSTVQNYPSTELESLDILNLRVGIATDRVALNLFASNLLNDIEAVWINANATSQYINGAGLLDSDPISTAVNRPRAFGVSLDISY